MMGQVKELQQSLLAAVGDRIAQYGFDRRPRGQSFYRSHDCGKVAFHLSFIEHDHDFDTTAHVAIRFDELEDLVQKDNKFLSVEEKKKTFSMGAELGNIAEGKPRRWTVRVQDDIEETAQQIVNRFEEIGMPYIDKYSTLPEAFAALSGDGPDAWLHSPFHGERAKRAVGLAWLLKDEKRLQKTIEVKTTFLRERKDLDPQSMIDLKSFKAFVDALAQ